MRLHIHGIHFPSISDRFVNDLTAAAVTIAKSIKTNNNKPKLYCYWSISFSCFASLVLFLFYEVKRATFGEFQLLYLLNLPNNLIGIKALAAVDYY